MGQLFFYSAPPLYFFILLCGRCVGGPPYPVEKLLFVKGNSCTNRFQIALFKPPAAAVADVDVVVPWPPLLLWLLLLLLQQRLLLPLPQQRRPRRQQQRHQQGNDNVTLRVFVDPKHPEHQCRRGCSGGQIDTF